MAGGGGSRKDDSVVLNSTNVFAALGTLRKKKKSSASDKDRHGASKSKSSSKKEKEPEKEPVFWAPAPLSGKSWADVDDEDDDDYYATTAPPVSAWSAPAEDSKSGKEAVEESESEEEGLDEIDDDVEEEHENEHEPEAATEVKPVVQKPVEAPLPHKEADRQLSKKELKKKELEELDAVLAELGYAKPETTGQEDSGATATKKADENGEADKKENAPAESKSAKKKKKKEKSAKEAKESQDQPHSDAGNGKDEGALREKAEDASTTDVKERLKKLASAKKKKSSKEMDAAARAAASEAAARSARLAAAKKKEKNHYNQQPEMAGGGGRKDDSVVLNSTNVFAALGSLKKKKKSSGSTDKERQGTSRTDSAKKQKEPEKEQVFWAPAPLSGKSWADVDDEDDDDYYATTAPPVAPWSAPAEDLKQDKEVVEESESEEEGIDEVDDDVEEEHENEHEPEPDATVEAETVTKKPSEASLQHKETERQLSKKELKKKGLEELDAVLAELGYAKPETTGQDGSHAVEQDKKVEKNGEVEKKENAPAESKSAKKKKKKEKSGKETKEPQDHAHDADAGNTEHDSAETEKGEDASAADVKERLKRMASAKKKKSSKEMDAAARAAASEAAARSAKLAAAKKKEKNHYNQQPLHFPHLNIPITKGDLVPVAPAGPIPAARGDSLYLSNLDDSIGSRVLTPTVYFYRADFLDPTCKPVMKTLSDALERVLVPYYPFTGRLRETGNGKLEVFFGEEPGVFIVEAFSEMSLVELGDLTVPNPGWEPLIYKFPDEVSYKVVGMPLLIAQVTLFRCGGFSLGLRLCHCICDGMGAMQFVGAWAATAKSGTLVTNPEPCWDREVLMPRNPPVVKYSHLEFTRIDDGSTLTGSIQQNPVQRCYRISREFQAHLKAIAKTDEYVCTTFDALAAHIWRSWVKALDVKPLDYMLRLTFSVNARQKLKNPPLKDGFYGNVVCLACAVSPACELIGGRLPDTANLVRQARIGMTEEYVRSTIDYVELDRPTRLEFGGKLTITQWTRFAMYESADFGWGRPVYAGPIDLTPTPQVCVLLAEGEAEPTGGILACICLPEYATGNFIEFLRCVD
ncbi:hypothetical protein Tsubulata_009702, partial [Turnera subulata]